MPASMGSLQIVRPAGNNERRCLGRESLHLYSGIVTIGDYTGSEDIGKPEIFQILKKCITEHAALSIVIQDAETERPQLAKCSRIDLDVHVRCLNSTNTETDHSKSLQTLIERVHSEPFDLAEKRPPWRVYFQSLSKTSDISQRFHLAFAFSHAVADGMSGYVFQRCFLRNLRNLPALEFDSESIFDVGTFDTILPLNLERAAVLPISWSFLLGPLFQEYFPKSVASLLGYAPTAPQDAWHGATKRPERSSQTCVPTAARVISISNASLQKLLVACRPRGVRMTGFLIQVLARSVARVLKSRGKEYDTFVVDVAIDMRKAMGAGKDAIANYVSAVVNEVHDIEKDTGSFTDHDWDVARRSTEHLSKGSSKLSDQPIALLRYLTSIRSWIIKNASNPAHSSLTMSNLGVFDAGLQSPNDKDVWNVEDMAFSQSADGMGAPLGINVASAQGGPLTIALTWWPGMLGIDDEHSFVDSVCATVSAELEKIAQE